MSLLRIIVSALLTCGALLVSVQALPEPRASATTGQEAGPPTPVDVWLRRLVGKYRFEGLVQVVARGDCAPLPPDPARQDQMSEAPPEPFCRSIKGTGDCIAVGKGPGVQCVLNVFWQDMYEMIMLKSEPGAESVDASPTGVFELPAGVAYLDPSMALFGLDPGSSSINYLLVDNKGMPEGGPGQTAGNRATFKTACVNAPRLLNAMKPEEFNDRMPGTCARTIHFDARQDSKVVLVTMDIDINDEVFTRATMTMRRQSHDEKGAEPAKSAAPAKPLR
jgi:hypothetical protein